MMKKVVIVGGGWAGSAAALAARNTGCEVELFERADMLLGTGLVGGIMRNNGRFTATEEMIAMGGGELFEICDACARHKNIEFPGHKHASLYDVSTIEPAVRRALLEAGVKIHLMARINDVIVEDGKIIKVIAGVLHNDEEIEAYGDGFVDTSGTAGPQGNCMKYGNGCVMCIYRCPTFGPRFSIAAKAGVKEIIGEKADGTLGAMSGACKLLKDSLAPEVKEELERTGVCVIAVPRHLQKSMESLGQKACQQYALKEFAENIVLLDTGHAKLMSAYYPLELLRQIPGCANARFEDPYAGGIGNSMRYFGMLPRDNALQVQSLKNVFCAGEKAGLLVGHTEAIVTGTLAGHNAARLVLGLETIEISPELACGDAIAYVNEKMQTKAGLTKKYTFSGSVYFERMKNKNLYSTNVEEIKKKVTQTNMRGIFAERFD
ncbi:Methylenetetrahydrofolate--tRNA-(uracil-5-)-methyltransferase TrmFO [Sporomusa silvacetica DSM 10669]|uniref:Methylenetetrahydrofolate--tRNA-(Uracil-5-)-methyltransferase TrmFO n=1 Tax=Sporomusa silvacetica DSM 10669 TaxID=1123289 RepID=A0ABZ3IUN0_9FIRM|nr:FAD-dependent oxidoreductase [Sporomusa silvacetica]OZC12988.1 methylenetetrahydrofolate--tRNA-(uracil-5-)-methyltransferase TrmFO [Sporomusa silvacetica DSM 10669]